MNEIYIHDPWALIFGSVRAMMDEAFGTEFQSRGLKLLIHKPHNLLTKKDDNGNIVSFDLQVVYTPFKKSDVKVSVKDNVLTISCGSENKMKDEEMIYCGISHQSYSFSLPLTDDVDVSAIKAKADDGMLYITIPMKKPEIVESKALEITID